MRHDRPAVLIDNQKVCEILKICNLRLSESRGYPRYKASIFHIIKGEVVVDYAEPSRAGLKAEARHSRWTSDEPASQEIQ